MLTLRTYAHAIREEEADLSFADFGGEGDSKRLYTSPGSTEAATTKNPAELTLRRDSENLEHETGLEPATPTLATWRSTN